MMNIEQAKSVLGINWDSIDYAIKEERNG